MFRASLLCEIHWVLLVARGESRSKGIICCWGKVLMPVSSRRMSCAISEGGSGTACTVLPCSLLHSEYCAQETEKRRAEGHQRMMSTLNLRATHDKFLRGCAERPNDCGVRRSASRWIVWPEVLAGRDETECWPRLLVPMRGFLPVRSEPCLAGHGIGMEDGV